MQHTKQAFTFSCEHPPCMVKTQFAHQTEPVQGSQKASFPWHLCKSQTLNKCTDGHIQWEDDFELGSYRQTLIKASSRRN